LDQAKFLFGTDPSDSSLDHTILDHVLQGFDVTD
jgi:hypothetical protein